MGDGVRLYSIRGFHRPLLIPVYKSPNMIQDPNSPNRLVFCFKNNKNSPWDLMMCPLRDATDGSLWDAMDGPLWDVADDPLWDAMDVFSKLLHGLGEWFTVGCNECVVQTFTMRCSVWFIVGCNECSFKRLLYNNSSPWTWWIVHHRMWWMLKLLDCNGSLCNKNL